MNRSDYFCLYLYCQNKQLFSSSIIASSASETVTPRASLPPAASAQKGALFSVGLADCEFTKMPLLLSKKEMGL